MNWFRNLADGYHAGLSLGSAIVISVSFALVIASLRLVLWFLRRKRNAGESEGEKEYWRAHGGDDTTSSGDANAAVGLDAKTKNAGTETTGLPKTSETIPSQRR